MEKSAIDLLPFCWKASGKNTASVILVFEILTKIITSEQQNHRIWIALNPYPVARLLFIRKGN